MGPSHRYDLLKESDDTKDEPLINSNRIPAGKPWWKYLFYMLLAASAGMGAAVGVVLATSFLKPGDNAATSVAASATAAADLAIPTGSTMLPADLTIPSTDVVDDEGIDKIVEVDGLEGQILECGWSFGEAREKGCVYDVMMQDWVPEPCYDPVLTEKYLAKGNYTWYSDSNGHVMSDEEMRKGEHGAAWMSARYHQEHCIFSWEKLIRALRNNRPISQELLSYDHVLHCRHQTLGGDSPHKRDEGAISVKAPTNYAKCALYNTWRNDWIPDKHSSVDK